MDLKIISSESSINNFKEQIEKTLKETISNDSILPISRSEILDDDYDLNNKIKKDDKLIIDARSKEVSGLDIFKILRLKYDVLNPVIIIGQNDASTWLRENPNDIIILSQGVNFIKEFDDLLFQLPYIKALVEKNSLTPFVQADFKVSDFGHEFANEFGLELMKIAHNKVEGDDSDDIIGKTMLSIKANFLYNFKFYSSDLDKIAKAKTKLQKDFSKSKILYIDDQGNNGWFNMMRKILKHTIVKGYIPDFTTPDHIKKLKDEIFKSQPNLILLDLRLNPEKDKGLMVKKISGYKVLKTIKKTFPYLPIIIISATNKTEIVNQLLQADAQAHWGKPRIENLNFSLSEIYFNLLDTIYSTLKKYSGKVDRQLIQADFYFNQIGEDYIVYVNKKFKQINTHDANYTFESNHIVLDTNFFRNPSYKYQIALYTLLLYSEENNKRIIVIDDVFQELFIGSSRKVNGKDQRAVGDKKICQYSLNKVQQYFDDFPKTISKGYQIMSWFTEDTFDYDSEGTEFHLFSIKKRLKSIHTTESDALEAKQEAISSNKMALHADDSFKYLINYLALDVKYNNVLFINNDYGAKKQAIDLLKVAGVVKNSKINYNNEDQSKPTYGYMNLNSNGKLCLLSGDSIVSFIWDNIAKPYFKK